MRNGFTLVELLVVVAVIGIISVAVIPNWRDGQKMLALESAAQKIAQDVRKTSEYALSGRNLDSFQSGLSCPAGGNLTGYGIFLSGTPSTNPPDETTYVIFGECSGDNEFSEATDAYVETIQLEKDLRVVDTSTSSIVFIPPGPEVHHLDGDPQSVIQIQSASSPSLQKEIRVNSVGTIEIQ